MKLPELQSAIKTKADEVAGIFTKADTEQEGVCTAEQITQIKTLNKEIEEMEVSAKSLAEQDALKGANDGRLNWLNQLDRRYPVPGGIESPGDRAALAQKSLTDRFLDSEGFKGWMKQIAPDGRVPERMRLNSPPISFEGEGIKTLITGLSSTSAGAMVVNDRKPIVDMGTFMRPLRIRDIIRIGQTTSDTVEYVRQGTHTNAAAAVAEATATSGGSGVKPESALALSVVTETVKTIATWLPATRRALSDAGQLRTLIDELLRYFLDEELEDQIIAGSGVGENFTGVLNTANTTPQAFDTDLLTTYRKARTKVAVTGRAVPTAYVIHPNDVEDLDLLTDNEERYYFGGPVGVGVPRLWGVPIVESEAMTEGTAMVAQWDLALLWDREQTNILVSDSHSDFFVRNLVAILAELRAAFGVLRPAAFVEIALS